MRSSDAGTIHIIGAGLAGLAAAVRLAPTRRPVIVHEATAQPGGRCRSYYDHVTGMVIDNGTHLLLSGNQSARSYLQAIGAEALLQGPANAEFQFADRVSGKEWTLRLNDGRFPWWIFDKSARVPDTRLRDYLPLMRLLWPGGDKPLQEIMDCDGPLYERLVEPLLLAAMNLRPPRGSASLAATVLRETLALGGKACRPLIAPEGIGRAFIDPAIAYLREQGVVVAFEHTLHRLHFVSGCVARLDFGSNDEVTLGERDVVVLAVPAYAAASLVPGLETPSAFRSIVNVHYRIDVPGALPSMIGVINGTAEWIFAFPGRVAVTVSDAGHLLDLSRETLAQGIWDDVAAVLKLDAALPPWQIVRERRATFAATPEENAKRPGLRTVYGNLLLAGDWTATGLPATIEGAVRSGDRAANAIIDDAELVAAA
ncbi:MAG TPA: hydroxysqualene dehydroxylase HpnE [Pseudolabrys sp.]|nr:hydroxysqualene dehydroxylase HpnE [Pseudolabrys sp.]